MRRARGESSLRRVEREPADRTPRAYALPGKEVRGPSVEETPLWSLVVSAERDAFTREPSKSRRRKEAFERARAPCGGALPLSSSLLFSVDRESWYPRPFSLPCSVTNGHAPLRHGVMFFVFFRVLGGRADLVVGVFFLSGDAGFTFRRLGGVSVPWRDAGGGVTRRMPQKKMHDEVSLKQGLPRSEVVSSFHRP